MSRLESQSNNPAVDALCQAVKAGDFQRAADHLADCPDPIPAPGMRAAAAVHLHHQRWSEALGLLNRLIDRQLPDELHRNLARNMLCLREYRLEIYETIARGHSEANYQIAIGKNNQTIIVLSRPPGPPLSLSADHDPQAAVRKALTQLQTYRENAQPVLLQGLGDGYLLNALARHPVKALLDQQQAIYLVEPDPQLVRVAMMVHDYTGPTGPIAQPRCRWFVGADWDEQYRRAFFDDLYLCWPAATVSQSVQAAQIAQRTHELSEQFSARCRQWREQFQKYYAALEGEELVAVMGDRPPRPPRALVLTTRFSTVLQHASRDVARAFEQLGWQAQLLIEPTDHHHQTRAAMQYHLAHFQPDLVFQIDHLRYEHQGLLPEELPFVCWVQDHLPNLLSRQAGQSVGPRDFVLTAARSMYEQRYGYPSGQLIDLQKLTYLPQRPARWASDGEDLVYVSNASGVPRRIADQLVEQFERSRVDPMLIRRVCDELLAVYERGDSVPTRYDFRLLFDRVERETGRAVAAGEGRDQLLRGLFNQVNSTLYRQQALGWAKRIAERRGLRFSLYGRGWEDHPQFAEHARGVIDYGEDLEALTRRSKINLQIVPYACFHQRLFDGLVSGGFFLVRRHPFDAAAERLMRFLHEHVDAGATSVEQALASVAPEKRDELRAMLDRDAFLAELNDPVDLVRSWQRVGLLDPDQPLLPDYDRIVFDSSASLEQRIDAYLDDEPLRRSMNEKLRRGIEQRLTYQAGMQRVVRRIAELIAREDPS